MSVQSEITRLTEGVAAAYAAAYEKGAQAPSVEKLDSLAETISSIPAGAQVASGSVTTARKSYMNVVPGFVVRKLTVTTLSGSRTKASITYDVDNGICTGTNNTSTITPTITSTSDTTNISNGVGTYFEGDYYWLATS